MIKRIVILVFILSAVTVLAMAPLNASAASDHTPKRQDTVEPGLTLVVETPDFDDGTPGILPVTGNDGNSSNTLTYALLAIIGVAVVVGGVALISRRNV